MTHLTRLLTDPWPNPAAAIAAAQAQALASHRAGTCHRSEWSCGHCEREAS